MLLLAASFSWSCSAQKRSPDASTGSTSRASPGLDGGHGEGVAARDADSPRALLAGSPAPVCPPSTAQVDARVDALLGALTSGPPDGDRAVEDSVLSRIVSLGPPASGHLLARMTRPLDRQGETIVRALGRLGHPCAVPALCEICARAEAGSSLLAADALVSIGHPAGLSSALRSARRPGPVGRRVLLQRIARLGRTRDSLRPLLVRLLGRLAAEAPEASMRVAAIRALRGLNDLGVEPFLLDRLGKDRDPLVRRQAAEALVGWVSDAGLPRLAMALADPFGPVAATAAEGLGHSRRPDLALPPLLEHLASGRRVALEPAIQALVRLGDPRAAAALMPLIEDRDPYVQAAAIRAMGHLCEARVARDALLSAMGSPFPAAPGAAIDSLVRLQIYEALPQLRRMRTRERDKEVRDAVIEALRVLLGA